MIHANGYWVGPKNVCHHVFDPKLSEALITFFKREGTVCDLGCGTGDYVREMRKAGIDADGYDGNPHTFSITNGQCNVLDLTSVHHLNKKYDWILSLEVGEHIPKEFESQFIENLMVNNTKGVVLSWAVKGQGGHGHVNCQNNDYIKDIFEKHGYTNDVDAENHLRSCISNAFWFKNTIMVFRK